MKNISAYFVLLITWAIICLQIPGLNIAFAPNEEPLKVGIAGLTHTHVHWILGREDLGYIEIVGIAESNRELAKKYMQQHGLPMSIVYESLDEMIHYAKPKAVLAFGSTFEHLEVVETCAPKGIHVMVEKPLAVNMDHAKKMAELAHENQIQLLTNYETTWYPTNHKTKEMIETGLIGDIRKVVIHDGHKGPKEIGVNEEFLEWLTDPVLNGGGAITDFGCYGTNLATWLAAGKKPISVTALTQTFKPETYPDVDDEATILLAYEDMQVIIQASWNWPFSRKDMEVYGTKGYIFSDNRSDLKYKLSEIDGEKSMVLPELNPPVNDPFSYLANVLNGSISMEKFALSSLENNLIVVQLLDAARKSAKNGETVYLTEQ